MNIQIRSIDFTAKELLLNYTKSKTGKLFRICPDLIRAEIVLKLLNTTEKENKRCEIRMVIPGNDLLANFTAKSFEEAVQQTTEILTRRVNIRKNKRIDYSLTIL